MKLFKNILPLITMAGLLSSLNSCSKSGGGQQTAPVDTTRVTAPTGNAYTFDSSLKSTGSFATMGAIQADGKIIIANNVQVARLNTDGTLDNGFTVGNATKGEFHSLALQADGRILLGGTFTSYNGTSKAYYLRLNTDGSVDNGFAPPALTAVNNISADVKSIAVQTDNKIMVGGTFSCVTSVVNGINYGAVNLIRVNTGGALDTAFKSAIGSIVTACQINCIRPLADGRMLVTGQSVSAEYFITPLTSSNWNVIVRLNANGSLDPSFRWPTAIFSMLTPYTYLPAYGQAIAVQDDGRILLGGRFETTSTVAAESYRGLVRLNTDGSFDKTLPQRGFTVIVNTLCLASDRLVVGLQEDPGKAYQNATTAILQYNKDGSDNTKFTINNFNNYGDTYLILEDASKNLILFGKFYDRLIGTVTYHGVVRLKKS